MTRGSTRAAADAAPDEAPRPVRMCDVCGGVDDHPRHVFAYAEPAEGERGTGRTRDEAAAKAIEAAQAVGGDALLNIIAHVRDDSTTMRHMDCCREVGCPDGTCNRVTAGAEDKKGDDLVAHLTSLTPEG